MKYRSPLLERSGRCYNAYAKEAPDFSQASGYSMDSSSQVMLKRRL